MSCLPLDLLVSRIRARLVPPRARHSVVSGVGSRYFCVWALQVKRRRAATAAKNSNMANKYQNITTEDNMRLGWKRQDRPHLVPTQFHFAIDCG